MFSGQTSFLSSNRQGTAKMASSLNSLSLRFNGHFPGEPGLAGVWSTGWRRWWWQLDYWSYKSCKAPVKSSPPTNQHLVFLQAGCPSCRPTNSVNALKGKHSVWTNQQFSKDVVYMLNCPTFNWYPFSLPSNMAGCGRSAAVLIAGFANADPLPTQANNVKRHHAFNKLSG